MSNTEKYDQAYVRSFSLDPSVVVSALEYNAIAEWDSIGHMSLIAELEEAFGITMETDDIVEFSSYQVGKNILKKYGVDL